MCDMYGLYVSMFHVSDTNTSYSIVLYQCMHDSGI